MSQQLPSNHTGQQGGSTPQEAAQGWPEERADRTEVDVTQQNPQQGNAFDPFAGAMGGDKRPGVDDSQGLAQQGPATGSHATTGGAGAEVDLSQLMARVTDNDAPRWMVVKDKLDHGPFSGRELVQMILQGQMQRHHSLTNLETGMNAPIGEWDDFKEFLAQAEVQLRKKAERAAMEESEVSEKTSNFIKATIAGAIVVVMVGSGLVIWLTRKDAEEKQVVEASVADLYERGEVDITGSAGILPQTAGKRGRRSGGAAAGGAGSYEDAMNKAIDLGSAEGTGSMRQLTSAQVAAVMNRHVNRFFGCVSKELRSGGKLSNVNIDLAIAGSGRVMGASARQGSPVFKKCIQGKARSVKFPSFPAPRMGARYTFNVDK